MLLLRFFRARDAVLTLFLGLALALSPVPAGAQDYSEAPYAGEEEMGNGVGLMEAPPPVMPQKVVAAPLGGDGYRPPVEPPAATTAAPNPAVKARAPVAQPAVSKAAGQNLYVVQAGDTAPSIAKKLLGSGKRWHELLDFNGIDDPNALKVGQRLMVPMAAGAIAPTVTQSPAMVAARPAPAVLQAPPAPAAGTIKRESVSADTEDGDASYYGQAGGTYTIQKGDTMAKIAKKTLGSTKRWRELARANPKLNPNKLIVGHTIVIPGPAVGEEPGMLISQQGQVMHNSFDATGQMPVEPPPAAPPPMSYGGSSAPIMSAPPPMMEAPPPPPPMMTAPDLPPPVGIVDPAATTRTLYREEKYRIPDELKPTGTTPYFTNTNGYHGLFDTECALYPYIKTWHLGFSFRYETYKYMNGKENVVEGRQWMLPLNILYTGRRFMAGLTVPFQDWQVKPSGVSANTVSMSSIHDPELKLGYQVWKNYEGTHAVSLHVAGRFTSDNYHVPFWVPGGASGKTRIGAKIGPANATRGSWAEFGGAYSGKINDRWNSHINLGMAHDSDDSISKYTYRGMLDYRVNQHFSLVGELSGTSWDMSSGKDGANVDLTLGMALFNERWQGHLGIPIKLQSDWGLGHDVGFVMGASARWD
jgi:nucleoid-associated protein YgaU